MWFFPPCCPVQVLLCTLFASCIFIWTNKDDDDDDDDLNTYYCAVCALELTELRSEYTMRPQYTVGGTIEIMFVLYCIVSYIPAHINVSIPLTLTLFPLPVPLLQYHHRGPQGPHTGSIQKTALSKSNLLRPPLDSKALSTLNTATSTHTYWTTSA